ncbi:MAG TPA: hypothetical protein VD788_14430, partial [Candidatus Polarisedimenticolaceae bacterium]|nr:hypothetical protein [Candidatus Polarisedimenticolaceae bacterium]
PRTAIYGALLTLGVIGGAIATHLFVVGIEIVDPATGAGDRGTLFGLAIVVAVLASIVFWVRKETRVGLARLPGRRRGGMS